MRATVLEHPGEPLKAVTLPDPTAGIDHAWVRRHDQLLQVGTELFGPPTRVSDVWLWRFSLPGH